MNVSTITMPKGEAKRRLQDYRRGLHRRADAEYEACLTAYRELALGRPVLDLRHAFALAPLDEKGRPRLAIARADRPQVRFERSWRSSTGTFDSYLGLRGRRPAGTVTTVTLPGEPREASLSGYALVPMVPPAVKRHHALAGCHILWEVEVWADRPIRAVPDRDPYLLRHIGGELYAVLGEWELTDVERAVMAGRAGS